MKSRDFVFWLQGFFELRETAGISEQQAAVIKQHLGMVFQHDSEIAAQPHSEIKTDPATGYTASGKPFDGLLIC